MTTIKKMAAIAAAAAVMGVGAIAVAQPAMADQNCGGGFAQYRGAACNQGAPAFLQLRIGGDRAGAIFQIGQTDRRGDQGHRDFRDNRGAGDHGRQSRDQGWSGGDRR